MDYYIGRHGDNALAGTSRAKAWRTFAPLRRVRLGPGDRVLLEERGTWKGPLRLEGSGSPEAPILLGSYGAARQGSTAGWDDGFATLPRPRIVGGKGAVVELANVSHWVVSGLEIECASGETMYPQLRAVDDPGAPGAAHLPQEPLNYGLLVRISAGRPGQGIVIEDCFVHGRGPNQNSQGILVSVETSAHATTPALVDVRILNNLVQSVGWRGIGTEARTVEPRSHGVPWLPIENLLIEGNAARNVGLQGICAFNAHRVVMRRNLVEGAGQYRGVGAKWGPAGLWPWSCADTLIEHNEVTGMFDGNTGADATGIDIDWNSHHVTVRWNHCYGNLGSGIVTMSCRECSMESNRVEGNLCAVNLGPGQIALSDYQTAKGPHAITGIRKLAIRGNLIILDRDKTAALSTVTVSGGAWEGVDFTGNRIVCFDHARDQHAYELHADAALSRVGGNTFYGTAENDFRARAAAAQHDLAGWRAVGRDVDSAFLPLDRTGPSPVAGLKAKRTRTGVTLSWTPSTDTLSGVHHYNVYRGSRPSFPTRYLTLIGQPEDTAFVDSQPGNPGEVWYKVEAEDACGNTSGQPAVVRVSWP